MTEGGSLKTRLDQRGRMKPKGREAAAERRLRRRLRRRGTANALTSTTEGNMKEKGKTQPELGEEKDENGTP